MNKPEDINTDALNAAKKPYDNVFTEIKNTEKSYNAAVKQGIEILERFIKSNEVSPENRLKAQILLAHLQKISENSKKLSLLLEKNDLAGCTKVIQDINQLYSDYVRAFNATLKDTSFNEAMKLFENTHRAELLKANVTQNCSAALINPVQRPPRYVLLIADLLKNFNRISDEAKKKVSSPYEPDAFLSHLQALQVACKNFPNAVNANSNKVENIFVNAKQFFTKTLNDSSFDSTWLQMQYLLSPQYFDITLPAASKADSCYYVSNKAQLNNLPKDKNSSAIIFVNDNDNKNYSVVFSINGEITDPNIKIPKSSIKVNDTMEGPVKISMPSLQAQDIPLKCYQISSLEEIANLPQEDKIKTLLIMPKRENPNEASCYFLVNGQLLQQSDGKPSTTTFNTNQLPPLDVNASGVKKIENLDQNATYYKEVNTKMESALTFTGQVEVLLAFNSQMTNSFLKTNSEIQDEVKQKFTFTQKLTEYLTSNDNSNKNIAILVQILQHNAASSDSQLIKSTDIIRQLEHAIKHNTAFEEVKFKIELYKQLAAAKPSLSEQEQKALQDAFLELDKRFYAFHKAYETAYTKSMAALNAHMDNFDLNAIMADDNINLYIKTLVVRMLTSPTANTYPALISSTGLSQEMLSSLQSFPRETWNALNPAVQDAIIQGVEGHNTNIRMDASSLQKIAINLNNAYNLIAEKEASLSNTALEILHLPNVSLLAKEKLLFHISQLPNLPNQDMQSLASNIVDQINKIKETYEKNPQTTISDSDKVINAMLSSLATAVNKAAPGAPAEGLLKQPSNPMLMSNQAKQIKSMPTQKAMEPKPKPLNEVETDKADVPDKQTSKTTTQHPKSPKT